MAVLVHQLARQGASLRVWEITRGSQRPEDVERAATPPEQRRDSDVSYCLFEVEPLQQVEQGKDHERTDRELQSPSTPPVEVVGARKKHGSSRNGKRVEDAQFVERLDLREH